MNVSWEAAILLNVISREGHLGTPNEEENVQGDSPMDQSNYNSMPSTSPATSSTRKRGSTNSMPSFVEALSIYRILRPDSSPSSSTTECSRFAAKNPGFALFSSPLVLFKPIVVKSANLV